MGRRSIEDRARAEVERIKAEERREEERLEARLEELRKEADARQAERAEQARQEAARRQETREAERAAGEEAEKRSAFRTWTANGGNAGDFEATWPELRREALKRRTLDAEERARAVQRDALRF